MVTEVTDKIGILVNFLKIYFILYFIRIINN